MQAVQDGAYELLYSKVYEKEIVAINDMLERAEILETIYQNGTRCKGDLQVLGNRADISTQIKLIQPFTCLFYHFRHSINSYVACYAPIYSAPKMKKILRKFVKLILLGYLLVNAGLGIADAAHIAFAEINADYFISCDDRLLSVQKEKK